MLMMVCITWEKRQDIHIINSFSPHVQGLWLLSLPVLTVVASPHPAAGTMPVSDTVRLWAVGSGDTCRGWPLRRLCLSGPGTTIHRYACALSVLRPLVRPISTRAESRAQGLAQGWTCGQARRSAQPAVTVQRWAPAPSPVLAKAGTVTSPALLSASPNSVPP